MVDRTTKLRWRRRFRKRRKQVEGIGEQAEEQLDKLLFDRMNRLSQVRRFVASWLLLLVMLIGITLVQIRGLAKYYQTDQPVPGGIFTEGVLGSFTNANPLYATGAVDNTVAHLVFSGLMKYNSQNKLVGDLAERWTVDQAGTHYTVYLRPNLHWHDGRAVTAADVEFTYRTIQNPDAKSPLFGSWQGIKVEAADARTIVFTLPNVLSSFPFSLTNGIVPKHKLADTPVSQLRSVRFNSLSPVGTGPFRWGTIEVTGVTPEDRQEQIGLVPNERYHAGRPKLQRFVVRSFRDEKWLLSSFENGELNAVTGLTTMPDTLEKQPIIQEHNLPLTGQVMVFFKTTHEILADVKVRQALVQSVDVPALVKGLGYPAIVASQPLLDSHLGYNASLGQLPKNVEQAKKLLDEAGWVPGKDGVRVKDNRPLTFRLYSQSTSEYVYVTGVLQKAWGAVGVKLEAVLQSDTDLQGALSRHDYDALLYGVSLGNDPDVFAYWHSSQADPRSISRLNLSEYKNPNADKALEAGRTRTDNELRAIKYRPFLEAWRTDAPALALYQPRFLYVSRGPIYNFDSKVVNSATDRFSNVENWMIRLGKTTK